MAGEISDWGRKSWNTEGISGLCAISPASGCRACTSSYLRLRAPAVQEQARYAAVSLESGGEQR